MSQKLFGEDVENECKNGERRSLANQRNHDRTSSIP